MDVNSAIDSVLRLVDREIWIVTAAASKVRPHGRGGLVATGVSQASLDPLQPIVVIALAANHYTTKLVDASQAFGLHLLSAEQSELAWHFGLQSGCDTDKFANIKCETAVTGSPIISDALAWLDCRVIARHDAGDRKFLWADVVDGRCQRDAKPLREHELFANSNKSHTVQLKEMRDRDISIQRPLLDAWRKELPDLSGS